MKLRQTALIDLPQVQQNGRPKPTRTDNGFVSSIWEFPTNEGRNVNSLYRWYGTLPDGLLERLFGLYLRAGDTMVDLFMGAGGSVIAASNNGIEAIGLDSNPLAFLIARLRLSSAAIDPGERRRLFETLRAPKNNPAFAKRFESAPEFSYATRWFNRENLLQMLDVLAAMVSHPSGVGRDLGLLSALSCVREVANVDARCTHHLVTKLKERLDVCSIVTAQLSKLLDTREEWGSTDKKPVMPMVRVGTARDSGLPSASADLVLLHPPYLGVIHYHNIHRLSTDLIRHYYKEVGDSELDTAYSIIRANDVSTDNESDYITSMSTVVAEAARITKFGGNLVLIMADHRFRGRLRHPVTRLTTLIEEHGLNLAERFIWVLNNNGGMHVKRKGHHIDHNYISVFRRFPS